MEEQLTQFRRDVLALFQGLRQSVDRPFRMGRNGMDRETFLRTMMMIEEARIRFNSYLRFTEGPSVDDWEQVRNDLLRFINEFLNGGSIDSIIFNRRFVSAMSSRDRDNPTSFIAHLVDRDSPLSVGDALAHFEGYLNQINFNDLALQQTLSFSDLGKIIPRQQVAPARFNVVGDKIVVVERAPIALESDRSNIAAALEHIREGGRDLIENLERSNCDRRLLESVKELHSQVDLEGNVVKLGLTNLACGMMCAEFQKELPDAINAMMNSYNASISMYVAQFPEWEEFTHKAAAIDLSDEDISDIDLTAGELIDVLESKPDLAAPEVPNTIKFVRELMHRPGASAKRAAFAMMRTIENLVSSIVSHSISALHKTAEKTVDKISTAASTVIVGLLGVALVGALGISSAALQSGAPWVKQATEIVQKQIESLIKAE